MKAIWVQEPFSVQLRETERPVVGPGEAIIRVLAGGICGSDMGIFHGTNALATYPRIIGHEFAGIVEEVGETGGAIIGQRVAVDPVVSCGKCYACRIGRHNVCRTLEVMGVHRDGGFAEYVKAPVRNLYPFTGEMSPEEMALVEPYSIGFQINARGETSPGDLVWILGAGPIGICAAQVALMRGARVLVSDVVEERLDRAEACGAMVCRAEQAEERLRVLTEGEGPTVVVDTACSPRTFEQAVAAACPAGRIVVIGLNGTPSSIVQAQITKKELTIAGSRLSRGRFGEVIEALEAGRLKPELLHSHTFAFDEIQDAFRLIEKEPQKVCKVSLIWK